ncbi:MAG: hypothetical protein ABSE84_34040 [Isosphaeraceae bacterium]
MSLLELTLETVEANLALDEALLVEADEGRAGAVLRFWDFPRSRRTGCRLSGGRAAGGRW